MNNKKNLFNIILFAFSFITLSAFVSNNVYAVISKFEKNRLIKEDKMFYKQDVKEKGSKVFKEEEINRLEERLTELTKGPNSLRALDAKFENGLMNDYKKFKQKKYEANEAFKKYSTKKNIDCAWGIRHIRMLWTSGVNEECETQWEMRDKYNNMYKKSQNWYKAHKQELDEHFDKTAMMRSEIKKTREELSSLESEVGRVVPRSRSGSNGYNSSSRKPPIGDDVLAVDEDGNGDGDFSQRDDHNSRSRVKIDYDNGDDDGSGDESISPLKRKNTKTGWIRSDDVRKISKVKNNIKRAKGQANDLLVKILEHSGDVQDDRINLDKKISEISQALDETYLGEYFQRKNAEINKELTKNIEMKQREFSRSLEERLKKLEARKCGCKIKSWSFDPNLNFGKSKKGKKCDLNPSDNDEDSEEDND
ncbi:MAG: hypothetical protein HQK49_19330 [Oligoflexia bacterium]|nr:hypothetical protein [Oligoflexia bacterium]